MIFFLKLVIDVIHFVACVSDLIQNICDGQHCVLLPDVDIRAAVRRGALAGRRVCVM